MNWSEIKNGVLLGACTLTAMLAIVLVYSLTQDAIRATEKYNLETALIQLFAPNSYDNEPSSDTILVSDAVLGEEPKTIYRARANGKPSGVVISATAKDGYNGDIELLVGLSYEGDVVAVRVTRHNETPGLGDDIEEGRSDWIYGFNNLAVNTMQAQDWQVQKNGGQFDQFTGATITPAAVVRTVYSVVQWYAQSRATIFTNAMGNAGNSE